MKKLTCLGLSIVMALSLLTACGGGETSTAGSETGSTPSSSAAQSTGNTGATQEITGTVNTDGSTSMADVMAVLKETFKEVQPGINVNYTGSGSGSGITNVLNGSVDIGLSSRALKAEEEEQGAVAHIVALDGVAVVVNPENTVADLTVEQIAKIFSGEITNWSEVGGADAEIAVFGRESGSGTRGAFEEIVGVVDACVYTNEYSSTGDMVGAVAGNPNAIGYASLSAVDESVVAVKVNGVAPSEATVMDGTYEIQRPFVMVTKEGAELSEAAQAFLDYATSAEVAEYIAAAGAVSPQA